MKILTDILFPDKGLLIAQPDIDSDLSGLKKSGIALL